MRTVSGVVAVLLLVGCGGPQRRCDRTTCASGCCSSDGQCQPGSMSSACGTSGNVCSVCSLDATCFAGACTTFGGSGGGSSSSGGGAAMGGGAAVGGGAAGGTAGGASAGGASGGGAAGGSIGGGAAGGASRVGCAGMQYSEPLPTTSSLGGLVYTPAMAQQYLLSALQLRYPHGEAVVRGGLANPISPQQPNCVTAFLGDTSSGPAVLRQASTVVHECGHFWDLGTSRGASSAYVIAPNLQRTCANGDTTTRGGRTFARSLIKGDAWYAMRPACMNMSSSTCDFYADVYLDGSPTNGTFESGDQGFNSLLEEANQYVNSLASALAFRDAFSGGSRVSERDGILTFMWYLERYLAMARLQYPTAYATLTQDACWREAILSVWDRGWFYLQATNAYASTLGINDARLRTLVETPSLLAEIDSVRGLHCP
ncbi:MAG: hypothetical protein JNJ54_06255 [Myxococcaceae bacterium]|nr:hypothetical protein [Myxococcaceae bacterium]